MYQWVIDDIMGLRRDLRPYTQRVTETHRDIYKLGLLIPCCNSELKKKIRREINRRKEFKKEFQFIAENDWMFRTKSIYLYPDKILEDYDKIIRSVIKFIRKNYELNTKII